MGFIEQPSVPIKSGIARTSGGSQQYGVPTRALFTSTSTSTLNVGEIRYLPMYVDYPVTLTGYQFEVTTGPGSAANFRIGVYLADTNLQPTGAPLYDSGSIVVANGFTGVKSGSGLSVALTPGVYLYVVAIDVSMAVRTLLSGTPIVANGSGANPFGQRLTATGQTYGAYANPGASWGTVQTGTGGLQHIISWQWTE